MVQPLLFTKQTKTALLQMPHLELIYLGLLVDVDGMSSMALIGVSDLGSYSPPDRPLRDDMHC